MLRLRPVAATAILLVALGQVASGQTNYAFFPAELPPADYEGTQYVDSKGCVFVRAGIGGVVSWVPRLTRDRQQLCGYTPTFAPGTMPTPGPIAPPPTPPSAPLGTFTWAEFCAGRSGPQPGYINAETGETVDCGGSYTRAAPELAYGEPFSNPLPATVPAPPKGYVAVWDDGRLNPQRGYAAAASSAPAVQVAAAAVQIITPDVQISTKTAPVAAPDAAGGSLIQVASFGVAANAARVLASLEAAGLPTQTQTVQRSGKTLTIVMVGPLQGGDVSEALGTVRANGFADAFVRS